MNTLEQREADRREQSARLRQRVLEACRQLAAEGVYPKQPLLEVLVPGIAGTQLVRIRKELVDSGQLDLSRACQESRDDSDDIDPELQARIESARAWKRANVRPPQPTRVPVSGIRVCRYVGDYE
ncbi:MAG TPA: hypothetical protein V6D47_00340 [Oscillatoriaceae cyanobacterium]